ncbi:hypothetical protein [Egicoccus sp. AB-alg6-2]|uniref:hypothetical protein n=1 Tax=Egicoccus sp. AB-alg6-2 TaxID=3242692 RepID=UPI00359DCBCF
MGTIEIRAVHLAVLGDLDEAGREQLCAVLAYDGVGHPHLHPLTPNTPAPALPPDSQPGAPGRPRQLRLPLEGLPPTASSSGKAWRTWVLPSIPAALRSLPPHRLAAAFAQQLTAEPVS